MRTVKQNVFFVAVLTILGCTTTTPQSSVQTTIDVYPASFEIFDQASVQSFPESKRTVYVSQQPLLTQSDFVVASLSKDNEGNPAVTLDLSEKAAQKLFDYTSKNVGKPLAIFIDGKLLVAPTVVSPIRNKIMITGGRDGLPENQAKDIVNSVNGKA